MKTRKTKYTCPNCGWSDGVSHRPLSTSEIRQCYKWQRRPKGLLECLRGRSATPRINI